ncbi:MAG: tryptophan--tRNA ligase [Actinomycetota bacterium]
MGRVFSGVKPTSDVPHLGNYIGAFRNFVATQDVHECLFCVVDLHAITVPPWDPKDLNRRTRRLAASFIAAGIDPSRSTLFVQSDVHHHTDLAWILTCISRMGELSRMTQYKDKSRGQDQQGVSVGLFSYPLLMAADILAYQANLVPIGDDQRQHLELTRDLAERFNREFGETFPVPDALIAEHGARIMALDDPTRKMDKSTEHPQGVIWMDDDEDTVRSKVSRAVTDSGRDVVYSRDKPAIANLLEMFSLLAGQSIPDLETRFTGKGYSDFKSALTDTIVEYLTPFQVRFAEVLEDTDQLDEILDQGAERAQRLASSTMKQVRESIGLRRP